MRKLKTMLLTACLLGACATVPATHPERVVEEATETLSPARFEQFPSTRTLQEAFDRQAAIDGSDRTTSCVEIPSGTGCGFETAAFRRAEPQATDFAADFDRMPDEQLDIAPLGDGFVGFVGLYGNGASAARRTHYLGQFATLVRVLSPAITESDLGALVDALQLRASPTRELNTRAESAFADISCTQGAAGDPFVSCSFDPPSIDAAFLRRLRLVETFPLPDATERANIWRDALPAEDEEGTQDEGGASAPSPK
ncbi:hypothetical protein [Terricaulis sp.]|uniref:hypothetical protein n=1 Tax=Terricaulis sp. TaxID=2768686 RepID=UPI002AC74BB9|nr:hypothetical protein [Terricaulis sp.]MDZ4691807.1 hypothetical protein [Terricaulis sp.]